MKSFPFLLFQRSRTLYPAHCIPTRNDGTRLMYDRAQYESGERPFELEVAWYPKGLCIRKLFVRPESQGKGVGKDIVDTLKCICREEKHEVITLDTVLTNGIGFWKHQDFHVVDDSGVWWNIKT